MNCIKNLDRINYPKDLVYDLTKLYTFKGKDFYYEDVLKQYMPQIIKTTIEHDVIAAAKILNLQVNENRLKLIIKKDSEPKTKHEIIVKNLKNLFQLIQKKGVDLLLTSNEFLQLGVKMFENAYKFAFISDTVIEMDNILETRKKVSRRDKLDEEIKDYIDAKDKLKIEVTQAITNFYVDLLNMKCFDIQNNFVSLLICYCLLFSERFNVFKYVSFFDYYYKNMAEFRKSEEEASYGWETGFSKTNDLNKLIIKMMLDGYTIVEKMIKDFQFDKTLRKVDNVGSVIMKLGTVFTREDVKAKVPNLSDSTINRALFRLRDEGKIRADGTGRSAKWVRLVPEEMFSGNVQQYNIFDFMKNDDEEQQ